MSHTETLQHNSTGDKSLLSTFINTFVSPGAAFDAIKHKSAWTWPALLLLLAMPAITSYVHLSGMTPEWLVDQQMQQMPDISASEKERIHDYLSQQANSIPTIAAITAPVVSLIIFLIMAGWYRLWTPKAQFKYGDWFRFSLWCSMPIVLQYGGVFILLALSNTGDVSIHLHNYASINQLFVGLPSSDSLFTLLESISLFFLWSIGLSVIGLIRWVQFSWYKSTILSLSLYGIIFGIIAGLT